MTGTTERFGLPLLYSGQSQKEVTHNEALIRADTLLHLAVESRIISAPPPAPDAGMSWIVPNGAEGDWTGHDNRIAHWHAGGWLFIDPVDGCLAWVKAEAVFAIFANGTWSTDSWPAKQIQIEGHSMLAEPYQAIAGPVGGSVVDAEVRATVEQILAALRSHGLVLS